MLPTTAKRSGTVWRRRHTVALLECKYLAPAFPHSKSGGTAPLTPLRVSSSPPETGRTVRSALYLPHWLSSSLSLRLKPSESLRPLLPLHLNPRVAKEAKAKA